MYYLYIESEHQTAFSPLDSTWAPGSYAFPEEFVPIFFPKGKRAGGFVRVTHDERQVLTCEWDEEAYQRWAAENPEPEPEPEPLGPPQPGLEERVAALEKAQAMQVAAYRKGVESV